MSGANFFPPITLLEAGQNPITSHGGNNEAGWISGNPASLAPSASQDCIFDLGRNWQQLTWVTVTVFPQGPSSGLNSVQATFTDSIVAAPYRRPPPAGANSWGTNFANLTVANGHQSTVVRPVGRYLHVTMVNADAVNPMGAGSFCHVALHYK